VAGTAFAFPSSVNQTTLGASDLVITRVGLGSWALGGGDWVLGWGPQRDEESIATIRRAIDAGVNWIDTSGVFGLGRAETIVARALRGVPRDRRPYLFVRCGLVWDDLGNVSHDLSPRALRLQVEGSLRRLRTDHLDLYQIGWASWPVGASAPTPASIAEAWEAMAALRQEGKVRAIGVAGCTGAVARLERIAQVTSVSLPYSLLRREMEQYSPAVRESAAAGVIACSTLGAGLLTGTMTPDRVRALPYNDWRRRHPFFQEMASTRVSGLVDRLRVLAARHRTTPAAVAIAWALRRPDVTAAVVGARHPWQVDEMVNGASFRLSQEDAAWLADGRRPVVPGPALL
jgi:aryl-alcohol dehydrogenase-like predicted oxidoreductase